MKIGVISLGCDKNRVDTEKMLARLEAAGHTFTSDESEADVIIVNTCAFIESAKEESIEEIVTAADFKAKDARKRIIVTGCLAQRYSKELEKEFPEVDAILGVADYDDIVSAVEGARRDERYVCVSAKDDFYGKRVLTTPYHYAYLKIADGCNNRCTYCAIPSIRGRYRSEKQEDLIAEAKGLAEDGVKELILVAQDVSRYGVDFDGKPHLKELVTELEKLPFDRIRLLYMEPETVDDDVIAFIKEQPKVAKYIDVPLQHIDDEVLRRMNRHTTEQSTRALVSKLRVAGITVRSTFICGFPGESEEAFEKLRAFIAEGNVDYAGFFPYSKEEGTPAYKLKGQIPKRIREKRAKELTKLQARMIKARGEALVGSVVPVTYDGIDYDRQKFFGRMPSQAPDVDGVVYFEGNGLNVGETYPVEILSADGVDLIGRVKNEDNVGN